jgi:dihydroxy-acid dehydratase
VVGHITPEASEGGLIGLLEDGDMITIDAVNNRLDVGLSDDEICQIENRNWTKPPYKVETGILKKFIDTVSTASEGCVTT